MGRRGVRLQRMGDTGHADDVCTNHRVQALLKFRAIRFVAVIAGRPEASGAPLARLGLAGATRTRIRFARGACLTLGYEMLAPGKKP